MKLYRIKKSAIDKKGRGLYATKDIKAGTKIINYVGKIISNKEVDESDKFDNKKPIYLFTLNKIREFQPEFLLFSAGFDAHINDPLAQLRLKSEDFHEITRRTLETSKSFCNGNVVSILEGGYDLKALQESTQKHVEALIEFN